MPLSGKHSFLALNGVLPVVFCCGSTQSSLWGGINSGTEDRIYNSHILLLIATPQQIAAPQNKSQCVLMPLQWGRLWIWPGYSGPAYLLCTMWYTYEGNENTNELPLPLAETSTGPTINFPRSSDHVLLKAVLVIEKDSMLDWDWLDAD